LTCERGRKMIQTLSLRSLIWSFNPPASRFAYEKRG
jgi:hypothetical protein